MAVVKSVRESGKVKHKILLYIGTFAEKNRHDPKHQRKFSEIISEKFAQADDFKTFEKIDLKQKIYDLLPEMYQTISFERELAQARHKWKR